MTEPVIERVEAREVRPDDVIVLRLRNPDVSHSAINQASAFLREQFPKNRIVVLLGDDELEVIREHD